VPGAKIFKPSCLHFTFEGSNSAVGELSNEPHAAGHSTCAITYLRICAVKEFRERSLQYRLVRLVGFRCMHSQAPVGLTVDGECQTFLALPSLRGISAP
jgi:hypothetical protein